MDSSHVMFGVVLALYVWMGAMCCAICVVLTAGNPDTDRRLRLAASWHLAWPYMLLRWFGHVIASSWQYPAQEPVVTPPVVTWSKVHEEQQTDDLIQGATVELGRQGDYRVVPSIKPVTSAEDIDIKFEAWLGTLPKLVTCGSGLSPWVLVCSHLVSGVAHDWHALPAASGREVEYDWGCETCLASYLAGTQQAGAVEMMCTHCARLRRQSPGNTTHYPTAPGY